MKHWAKADGQYVAYVDDGGREGTYKVSVTTPVTFHLCTSLLLYSSNYPAPK